MKKPVLLICLLLAAPFMASAETLGILGFTSSTLTSGELEFLNTALENSAVAGGNETITLSDRGAIIEQIKFSFSGVTEEKPEGLNLSQLAAKYLIAGNAGVISKNRAYIIIKKIDTSSGRTESTVRSFEKDLPAIFDNMDSYFSSLMENKPGETLRQESPPDRFIEQKDPYKLNSTLFGVGISNLKFAHPILSVDGRLGFSNFSSPKLGPYISFNFGYLVFMDYNEYGTPFSWSNIHFTSNSLFGAGYRLEIMDRLIFVPTAGISMSWIFDFSPKGFVNLVSGTLGAASDLNLYFYLTDTFFLQLQVTGGVNFLPFVTLSFSEAGEGGADFGTLNYGLSGGISLGFGITR